MPTRTSGRLELVETAEFARDRVQRLLQPLGRDRAVQPKLFGQADGPEIETEALVHLRSSADGELGTAAPRIEDDEAAAAQIQRGDHRDVSQPRLFFAGDHLDVDATPLPHGGDESVRVAGDPQAHGPDRGERGGALLCRFLGHPRNGVRRPHHGGGSEIPSLAQAFPKACHFRPVDERAPRTVGETFANVELDRVGPDVYDREHRHDRGQPSIPTACLSHRG